MNCRIAAIALLIALLILSSTEIEARPSRPSALDSTDRVVYVYDGPDVEFGPVNAIVEIEVTDYYELNDVDVLLSIEHPWTSDVSLRLENPQGQSIRLVEHAGGDQDNFTNTEFNDDADEPIWSGWPPFTGSFRPVEPLSDFNGGTGTGTWILHLEDNFASADDGFLTDLVLTLGGRVGGVVRGRVTSLATQQPLSGVLLEFLDTPYSATTDETGNYSLISAEGTFDLLVSYPDWCSEEINSLVLALNDTLDHDFELGKPEAAVSSSSLNVLASQDTITSASLTLTNDGNCPLDWSLEVEAEWIVMNPLSGTIAAAEETEIIASVDAENLAIGDYLSRIVFTHNAEGSPRVIPVFVSVILPVNAGSAQALPQEYKLIGAYPNPFNATTSVRYALPVVSDVRLQLYSSSGRLVEERFEAGVAPGYHDFRLDLQNAASGLYFANLSTGSFTGVQKLILIK